MTNQERIVWIMLSAGVCCLLLECIGLLVPPESPWDFPRPMGPLLFVFHSSTCVLLFVPLLARNLHPMSAPWAIMFLLCLTLLVVLVSYQIAGFSSPAVGSPRMLLTRETYRHVFMGFIGVLAAWTLWSATQVVPLIQSASGWRAQTIRVLIIVHLFACGSVLICANMIRDRQSSPSAVVGGKAEYGVGLRASGC